MPEQGEKPAEHGDLKDMCDEHAEEMVRKVNMQPVSEQAVLHYTYQLAFNYLLIRKFEKLGDFVCEKSARFCTLSSARWMQLLNVTSDWKPLQYSVALLNFVHHSILFSYAVQDIFCWNRIWKI